ncbi:MAG: hypothetical protein IKE89_03520 [Bacilli bacterium]|nr:hypothetical protein [Bacilli bacterium]MBR2711521.1 hypothetical protein [Bacilli bacterium]
MSKIINGVASEYDFPFKDFDVRYNEESIQKFNRWQDPTIEEYHKEIERLNNIIDEKDYKIKRIVYSCYESDMSYDEFKRIWVNTFGELYDPKDIDKLENELKGDNK